MKFIALSSLILCSSAWTQLPSDDFSLGNTNGWTLNEGSPAAHNATGGFPGGCLNVPGFGANTSGAGLNADVLRPTVAGHGFSGDFRSLGVRYLSTSYSVIGGFTLAGDEWAIYLADDNGTPAMDDDAFLVGGYGVFIDNPQPWISGSKAIPSDWLSLPPGWWTIAMPNSPMNGMSHDARWNAIMTDVDYVGIGGDIGATLPLGDLDVLFDNIALQGDSDPLGTFCYPGSPNSTGDPVVLSGGISPLANSDLHLSAEGGPPGEFGYFLVGNSMVEPGSVLGDGFLCLGQGPGNVIGRYNVQGTPMNSLGVFDSAGIFQNLSGTSMFNGAGFDVPFALPIPGSPTIQQGETWYFQLWHRDTAAGIGHSNLSNGFGLTFP